MQYLEFEVKSENWNGTSDVYLYFKLLTNKGQREKWLMQLILNKIYLKENKL